MFMGKKTIFYGYVYIYEYIFKHLKDYVPNVYSSLKRVQEGRIRDFCFFCNILCVFEKNCFIYELYD